MNNLREGIADYLELRRSLGFKLKKDERLLLDFAQFMERRRATRITSKLALAWAQRPESTDPNYLAGRLRAKIKFAYGYKFNEKRMQMQKIVLPIDSKEQPNWKYMETYMQRLEQQQIVNYLSYI